MSTPLIEIEVKTITKIKEGVHYLTKGNVQTYKTHNSSYILNVYDANITKAGITELIELLAALKEAAQS